MAKSAPTKPRRTRTAARAGARPPCPGRGLCARALIASGGPGELRGGQTRLALVLDAEGVDPRAPRFCHGQVRPGRVEHAVEPDRTAGLDPERHDVLDLEVDGVPNADAVPEPVVPNLDRRPLDPDDLAHEGSERGHRTAELPAEDLDQLVELLVRGLGVDKHPEPPVALGHDLGGVDDRDDFAAPDIGAVDLTLADVEGQGRATEVVGRAMVELEVSRAHQLTRARLAIAALQVPRHRRLPSRSNESPTTRGTGSTALRVAPGLGVRAIASQHGSGGTVATGVRVRCGRVGVHAAGADRSARMERLGLFVVGRSGDDLREPGHMSPAGAETAEVSCEILPAACGDWLDAATLRANAAICPSVKSSCGFHHCNRG